MTTIFVVFAFVSGLLAGGLSVWRWGGMLAGRPFRSAEAVARNEEAQASVDARNALRKERIMEAAEALGKITNDGVEDLFCISDRTASRYLQELTQAGKLERFGEGRGTYYEPSKQ